MALKYPFLIIIVLVVMLAMFLVVRPRKQQFKKGKKVANTEFVKRSVKYKKFILAYKILSTIVLILNIIAIVVSSVLASRVYTNKTVTVDEYSRDIMLCLDVSESMKDVNLGVVASAKEVIGSLENERLGISIFATISYLLVPLTNDYEYLDSLADEIGTAIRNYSDTATSDEEKNAETFLYGGTRPENNTRGKSLIGDGLASCIYDFNDLDTVSRPRNIIFVTDNAVIGTEYVNVTEASEIARKYGIIVYAIAPEKEENDGSAEYNYELLKTAALNTGGQFYTSANSETARDIVTRINEQEKDKVESPSKVISVDYPEIPVVCLFVTLSLMFCVEWWIAR